MKRKTLNRTITVSLILLITASTGFAQVIGRGDVVKQDRDVENFNGVSVQSGIDLTVKQGTQQSLVIEADDNIQEYIISEVKEGILYVYVKKNTSIRQSHAMDAHVTVTEIKKISASGGGDVESLSMINADEISISISGGGDLSFELTADRATCSMSGGGDVAFEGSIKAFKASLSGGGDIALEGEIGMLDINLSGGGDLVMELDCENIKISSSGGGDVTLDAGENVAKAGINISGGGDLAMDIKAVECMISVGGGGDASLSGSAEKFYGEMKSGGDLSASEFMVQAAKLNLTGGSDAKVHVEQELKVDASGGSQVYVSGDPHIEANLTGGSKVHKN